MSKRKRKGKHDIKDRFDASSTADIDKLLLEEEYKAERVIAIVRFLLYGISSIELFVYSLFPKFTGLGNFYWLMGAGTFLSALMLGDIIIAGRPRFQRLFNPSYKYIMIAIDVLLFSAIIYFLTILQIIDTDPKWFVPLFFMMATGLLLIVGVFRFNPKACVYTGTLCFLAFYTLCDILFNYESVWDFYGKGEVNIATGATVWAILAFTILATFVARRVRFIVVRTKRQQHLERFLPEVIAKDVLSGKRSVELGGRKQRATVLFADIRNFTQLAEEKSPEDVVDFLNSYFNDMIEVIFRYDGSLDKIVGDGIMAVYGIPQPKKNDAENAVHTAIDMLRKLTGLNELRSIHGEPPIRIGIGVHTGDVIMGNVGSHKRMDYTAIGDTVNTAARLEGLTKNYDVPILISEATKSEAQGNGFRFNDIDTVNVKGKERKIHVYSVDIDGG